ncbi:MAG: hypothetical protein ACT6S0_17430 [Roseateles sp.]|uniref:hypothetical protein n=1 Tax=Roseateles sp. TaxID=1971397 RepID=UPI004036FA0D
MSQLEVLSRQRPLILSLNALAFTVWQVTEIQLVHAGIANETGALRFMAPAAIALWVLTGAALLAPFIEKKRSAAEDELTRHNRLIAFYWGYGITMLAVGAGLIAAARTDWPAIDIVRLILITGVVAPLLRFALMEHGTPDDE